MNQKRIHGVLNHQNRNLPGRVINVRSKNNINNKIRLDKLLRSTRPKILIKRRLGGIGDVLMTTPLLRHIKRILPSCELTYATDLAYSNGALATIIEHNPYVDILIQNGRFKESDYDYSVDITATGLDREKGGNIPPNRIDMFAEEVGIDVSSDPLPDYIVRPNEREWAQKEILKYIPKGKDRKEYKIVMLQCRSNDKRRTWPRESVNKLAELIIQDPTYIVLMLEWGVEINLLPTKQKENLYIFKDLTLQDTASLMEQVDIVVCPDSSLLHLAGALNKKTVTIFGPIPPESRINYYPNATAVTNKLSCQYCWYNNCRQPKQLECLTGLQPEEVLLAIKKKAADPIMVQQNIQYGQELTSKGQDPIILIKRSIGGLGDILMAGPGLKALKEKYKDKQIHFAIPKQYMPVMENLPFVDRVLNIEEPINTKRYFAIMDISSPCARYETARLTSGKEVEKNRIEIYAEAMGVRELLSTYVPIYNITSEEKQWAKTFLASQKLDKNKPIVCLQLKSAEEYRDYPEPKYQELFNLLIDKYNVILLGSSRDNFYYGIIDACGFPIRKWAAVLGECDYFISVDTGPLHVAAALNIPTIALFGPIDYRIRCKGYKNIIAITANLDCVPCWRNAITKCNLTGNVMGYSKCMYIPPKEILKILEKGINKQ
jgi:ADP-heptose:LPS heptosyltransferase